MKKEKRTIKSDAEAPNEPQDQIYYSKTRQNSLIIPILALFKIFYILKLAQQYSKTRLNTKGNLRILTG